MIEPSSISKKSAFLFEELQNFTKVATCRFEITHVIGISKKPIHPLPSKLTFLHLLYFVSVFFVFRQLAAIGINLLYDLVSSKVLDTLFYYYTRVISCNFNFNFAKSLSRLLSNKCTQHFYCLQFLTAQKNIFISLLQRKRIFLC